jgi:hypothetical protein
MTMRRPAFVSLLLASLCFAPGIAPGQELKGDERIVASSEAFLGAHPDLRYRLSGLDAHERGEHAGALVDFQRAARYGDKPSQSMLGEMHWQGVGTPVDRGMGYVWMDLAAERGYPLMLAKREHYWASMDEAERARALAMGAQMYDEYGDAAAKPRLERELKRARRNMTGSRVGSVGRLEILIPTPGGTRRISGDDYYDPKFWEPEQYFRWQDSEWLPNPKGVVEVGDIVADDPPSPHPED